MEQDWVRLRPWGIRAAPCCTTSVPQHAIQRWQNTCPFCLYSCYEHPRRKKQPIALQTIGVVPVSVGVSPRIHYRDRVCEVPTHPPLAV